jgi:uncharacterized protein (TIGR03437 family)
MYVANTGGESISIVDLNKMQTTGYRQSAMIVKWSGLVPGPIGINQINITVPGDHMKGDAVPVVVRIGGVSSSTTGTAVPLVAIQ